MMNIVSGRNIQKTVLALVLFLGGSSCLDPFAPPAISTNYNYLSVGGRMLGGSKDSTVIRLTRSRTLSDISAYGTELLATVQLEASDGVRYTLTESGDGYYYLPPTDFDGTKKYRLKIKTLHAKEYESDFVPLKPTPAIDNFTWKQDEQAINFYISTHDESNETRYYQWFYDETWKYNSFRPSQWVLKDHKVIIRDPSTELYYCWNNHRGIETVLKNTSALSQDVINDFQVFQVSNSSRKLYYEYSVLVHQYALTEEAYQYWNSVKSNSEHMGGLYDPLPAQAQGNIHSVSDPSEPVIGFFSACIPTQKRISFTRQEINGPSRDYEPSGYEDCTGDFVPIENVPDGLTGWIIIQDAWDPTGQFLIGYGVASEQCMDCRFKGGVTKRPNYWGN
jgi:hypothetical protein